MTISAGPVLAAPPSDNGSNNPVVDPPVLYLRTPAEGATLDRNASLTITWTYMGAPGPTVKLLLLKSGEVLQTIATSVSTDDRSYRWPIPAGLQAGGGYQIKIISERWAFSHDTSHEFTLK